MNTPKLRVKTSAKAALQKLRAKRSMLVAKPKPAARSVKLEMPTSTRTVAAVKVTRVALVDVAVSRSDLANRWDDLSDSQRAALTAARERAEARLRRPDMAPEAVSARERAGADWEAQHGPVAAFAGKRFGR